MLLKILAAIGLVVIVVIALAIVAFFVIRGKFRKFVAGLGDLAGPPSEATLVPAESLAWKDSAGAARAANALKARGFVPAGRWTVAEMPGVLVDAFAHPAEGAWGVVCEHPQAGVWIDVVSVHADKSSITFTNAKSAGTLEQMPGRDKVVERDADPERIVARFFAERPNVPRAEHSPDRFKEDFERAYREEMEWRDARGGATEAEVERVAADMDGEFTKDQIGAATRVVRSQANDRVREAVVAEYLRTSGTPEDRWQELEHRVVVLHDGIEPDDAKSLLAEWLEDDDLVHEVHAPARDLVHAVNAKLPLSRRFRPLGTVEKPVVADLYIGPEED